MSDPYTRLRRRMSRILRSATSSPGSEDGAGRLNSPDGLKTDLCGLEAVLVSRSAQPENLRDLKTIATCGLNGIGSYKSANLQSFLESRLRVLTAGIGSHWYAFKWKNWIMKSGPPICALRASALKSSGKDCGLWRGPASRDWRDLCVHERAYASSRMRHQPSTVTQAYMKGYATSHVPEIYQILMGYPDQWAKCAPLGMPSYPKQARSSSKRLKTSKPDGASQPGNNPAISVPPSCA